MTSPRSVSASHEAWSLEGLPDLTGTTAVVTGANSGIGFAVTRELARAGADVVMACRDPHRGDEALGQVRVQVPRARVSIAPLDLADLASVRAFADALRRKAFRLDVLVNNAGVMAIPRRRTADGFEAQLGTNHLGHFALTGLLLPLLEESAGAGRDARVVTVSSLLHRFGRLDRDDLQFERGYRRWPAYHRSKLANLLFAFELQRRLAASGSTVRSVAAHPGVSATNLVAAGPMTALGAAGRVLGRLTGLVLQPAEQGAWPVLRAATDPAVCGGEYYGPDGPGEVRGAPVLVGTAPSALDTGDASWLWQRSEELTGVPYLSPP